MEEQNKTLRFEIYALGAAEINVVSYSYLKYKNSNIISMQVNDDKSLLQFIKSKAMNGIPMMIKMVVITLFLHLCLKSNL